MLRLVYLASTYCWYDGSLLDLWPFKTVATLHHRYRARRRKRFRAANHSKVLETPDQALFVVSPPVPQEESYPAGSSAGAASVRDVENVTPVPSQGSDGGSDGVEPASHLPLLGSNSRSTWGAIGGSTRTEGQSEEIERDDNDLKRSVIAAKLTPLVMLTSFVSDLDVVADWVFFEEGLRGEGELIYVTALVFAVVGTIMYVLVTVEFHLVSLARTWWSGKPLSPLQHLSLGWQLGINVLVEDIPQLVITCAVSPTSATGMLNITTAAFALLAKMAEAFASRRDLPMSSQLLMIEANPELVRHAMELRSNAEGLADNAAELVGLANRFGEEVDGSKRQAAIAFRVMQVDPNFLDGRLDYIREKLQSPSMGLDNCFLEGSIPPSLGDLTQLTKLDLSANELSGPIPPELRNLSALTTLNLGDNDLTGTIPPSLGELSQLRYLDVRGNELRGLIPDLRQTALHTAVFCGSNLDGNKADAQRQLPENCTVRWKDEAN